MFYDTIYGFQFCTEFSKWDNLIAIDRVQDELKVQGTGKMIPIDNLHSVFDVLHDIIVVRLRNPHYFSIPLALATAEIEPEITQVRKHTF